MVSAAPVTVKEVWSVFVSHNKRGVASAPFTENRNAPCAINFSKGGVASLAVSHRKGGVASVLSVTGEEVWPQGCQSQGKRCGLRAVSHSVGVHEFTVSLLFC